jgi:hypothetical protein
MFLDLPVMSFIALVFNMLCIYGMLSNKRHCRLEINWGVIKKSKVQASSQAVACFENRDWTSGKRKYWRAKRNGNALLYSLMQFLCIKKRVLV